ncbi:MAG TPA: endolytic transglycosylase MltG, partial [Anaerolineae bacterium]|nr:endolytic transglycosylase MltG [Anaerolineae bacterium]
ANPGAASINATLLPEPTNFLFFMGCGGEGAHIFAETFEEHEVNVAACQ